MVYDEVPVSAGVDVPPGMEVDPQQVVVAAGYIDSVQGQLTPECYQRAKAILAKASTGEIPSGADLAWLGTLIGSNPATPPAIPAGCRRVSAVPSSTTAADVERDGSSWPWWIWVLIAAGVLGIGYFFYTRD